MLNCHCSFIVQVELGRTFKKRFDWLYCKQTILKSYENHVLIPFMLCNPNNLKKVMRKRNPVKLLNKPFYLPRQLFVREKHCDKLKDRISSYYTRTRSIVFIRGLIQIFITCNFHSHERLTKLRMTGCFFARKRYLRIK